MIVCWLVWILDCSEDGWDRELEAVLFQKSSKARYQQSLVRPWSRDPDWEMKVEKIFFKGCLAARRIVV